MNYDQHFCDVIKEVKRLQKNYPSIEKVVLFGSRARGDHRYNSDIDLCVFAPDTFRDDFLTFSGDIEEIHTYYSFDVLFWYYLSNDVLKQEILEEGIEI